MHCPSLFELPPPPHGYTGWPWTAEAKHLPDLKPNGDAWPLISVITPSYNQAEYLEATIRSILLQGYPNLEYMVMDGGSTDGSVDIIQKYAPWLTYWQSQPDGGQYKAIQTGFERSTGDVMAWLNSDDLYFPWTLGVIGELFSTFPQVRWLVTGMPGEIVNEENLFSFYSIPGHSRRAFFSQKFNGGIHYIQQESCFWRRSLWHETDARLDTTLEYAGDLELWARFWQKDNLYTVATPLAMFRRHNGQKTSAMDTYIKEGQAVLKRYHRPFPIPRWLLSILGVGLRLLSHDINWFDVGAHKLYFSALERRWYSVISFRVF
jgi:glycosyltransferase involved in cell wall biosynthesis